MEQATDELLDEKTKDLIITYIVRYDDIEEAIEKAGITPEEFSAWYKSKDFEDRLHTFITDCAKTVIRSQFLPEPILQWLENIEIEILPLLYNFDGLEDDDKIEDFIDKHNIYVGDHSYTHPDVKQANPGFSRTRHFRAELNGIKVAIDKHLTGEELSEPEKLRARNAHNRKKAFMLYNQPDGIAKKYKHASNPGSIYIGRAYADLLEVIQGKKQITRCADPKCNKIFVPRYTGGRKQEYHSNDCARRVRQREAYRRQKSSDAKRQKFSS